MDVVDPTAWFRFEDWRYDSGHPTPEDMLVAAEDLLGATDEIETSPVDDTREEFLAVMGVASQRSRALLYMRAMGVTQVEVADRLALSQPTVSVCEERLRRWLSLVVPVRVALRPGTRSVGCA